QPAPTLDTFRPEAPPELVTLVADCLRIDPEERPASVGAVIERLDDIMRALPRTKPSRAGDRVRSRSRRASVSEAIPADRRRRILLGSTAGIGALAIALLWWR